MLRFLNIYVYLPEDIITPDTPYIRSIYHRVKLPINSKSLPKDNLGSRDPSDRKSFSFVKTPGITLELPNLEVHVQ